MKIAIVAPVEERIPPSHYGGIEGVVHELARGLVARGHEVTLLASGDSSSPGELNALSPKALRHCAFYEHPELVERAKMEAAEAAIRILAQLKPDIVHNHMWRLLPLRHRVDAPMVTTVHYPLDGEHRRPGFTDARDANYVSISLNQQRDGRDMNFVANIYNGVDVASYTPAFSPGRHLLFLGRVAPEKGVDTCIEVAECLGLRLIIAAKFMTVHSRYYDEKIRPRVDERNIRYVGEVGQRRKRQLLRDACALLYPIRWNEPFGLAIVEAMASGTPVVAFNRGAAAEIIVDGRTGFLVENAQEMARAVSGVGGLSRRACRVHAAARFGSSRMVDEYEAVYTSLTGQLMPRPQGAQCRHAQGS
jgi:glycosyltransferase involved in cell wall biosynthesis